MDACSYLSTSMTKSLFDEFFIGLSILFYFFYIFAQWRSQERHQGMATHSSACDLQWIINLKKMFLETGEDGGKCDLPPPPIVQNPLSIRHCALLVYCFTLETHKSKQYFNSHLLDKNINIIETIHGTTFRVLRCQYTICRYKAFQTFISMVNINI